VISECKRVGGKTSSNPKEIPEQNFAKYSKYGKASIYSASAGEKKNRPVLPLHHRQYHQ
jgi:hypothetical protein